MMPDVTGKQVAQYKFERRLGAGAFGQVYLASKQNDKELYAIKMIAFDSLKNSDGIVGQLLKEEINALATIDNPNVIKCIEYIQTKNNCYIVTEYCNCKIIHLQKIAGDLEQLLLKKGHFEEQVALDIMKQILNGLSALHRMNYMHRDIKLPNILIHNNSIFKMADLGFCIKLNSQDSKDDLCLGSKGTMAPEVMMGESYGLNADIFSAGAIFYQLLFGQLPFNPFQSDDLFLNQVKQQKIDFQYNGIRVSGQIQELIKKMLQYYPEDRITFKQLYQTQIFQLTGSMIKNQQVSRISKVTENYFDLMKTQHFYETKDTKDFQTSRKIAGTTQQNTQNIISGLPISEPKVTQQQQYQQQQQQQQQQYQCEQQIQLSNSSLKITEQDEPQPQKIPTSKLNYLVDPSQISPSKKGTEQDQKNAVVEKYYDRLNSQQYLIRTFEDLNQLEIKQSLIVKQLVQFCAFIIFKKRKQELQRFCQILKYKVNIFNSNQIEAVINQIQIEQLEDTLNKEIEEMQNNFDEQIQKLQNLRNRYFYHKWLSEFNAEQGPLFDEIYLEVISATIEELKPFIKQDKSIACCIIHLQGCLNVKALMDRKVNLYTEFTNLAAESLESIVAKIK